MVALAVSAGIVVDRSVGDRWVEQGLLGWWLAAWGCLGLCMLMLRRHGGAWSALWLALTIVCLGGSWHHLRWHYYEHDHLGRFASDVPQPVCLQAVALNRLKWSPAPPSNPLRALPVGPRSEIEVRVTRVRDGQAWRQAAGTCNLRVNGELRDILEGDQLLIFAKMGRITPALNPGEYDWSLASRGAGRYCDLYCSAPECVTVTQTGSNWVASRWLQQIGQRCERRLASYVRPAQRDLALAILLGARERLHQTDRLDFLRTGTIHLLVVSGLHVGLLALAVWAIVGSGFLSHRTGLLLTALLVVGYALLVGSRPPVMRASVLVVLTLFSYAVGRRPTAANLLSAAALLVLAINPSELFRSGTQLSFLCVATLAAYGSVFQQERRLDPLTRLVRDSWPWYRKAWRWTLQSVWHTAAVSLAIWLVVAPLVAYHFHITAPISILVTPLLWPFVAIALISGLAICSVAWVFPPLAWLLGELCSFCLWSTESIVGAARQLEFGSFYLPGPPSWWVLAFYGGMLAVFLFAGSRMRLPWQLSLAAIWIAVGLAASGIKDRDDSLRCNFLSVGHGTCVVLELPGGETLLYDAGSLGSPERATTTIASFLWSRGITHVDAIVLSHADVDHYNALPGLLERFGVGKVYVSPLMFDPWINDGRLDAPSFLQQTLTEAEVPLEEIWINDRLRTSREDLTLEVLHPPQQGVPGQDNANSLLLAIHYAGHSILLPGDLESPGIEAVTAERPQHFDILLAPHHGSRNSDPPGFAAWCTPRWVVVSGPRVSPDEQFTADSYRNVGAMVFHTADVGAVQFTLDDEALVCSQYLTQAEASLPAKYAKGRER